MYLAGYKEACIENGYGCRTSVFVSGCTHKCKGCFNEKAWSFTYGKILTENIKEEIIESLKPRYVDGITILGGEPMEPANQEEVLDLILRVKERFPKKTIWVYSGYLLENLLDPNYKRANTKFTRDILENIDVLVDGPFILEEKDLSLLFRGSRNQRVIDMKKTLKENKIILSKFNK